MIDEGRKLINLLANKSIVLAIAPMRLAWEELNENGTGNFSSPVPAISYRFASGFPFSVLISPVDVALG